MTPKAPFSPPVYVRRRCWQPGAPFSSTARLVAAVIASYIQRKADGHYIAYAGYVEIGKAANLHKMTVRKAILGELTTGDDPVFELQRGRVGRMRHDGNIYTIPARYVAEYYQKPIAQPYRPPEAVKAGSDEPPHPAEDTSVLTAGYGDYDEEIPF